jgi:hypothetical protein
VFELAEDVLSGPACQNQAMGFILSMVSLGKEW